jgi:hypothetical protein
MVNAVLPMLAPLIDSLRSAANLSTYGLKISGEKMTIRSAWTRPDGAAARML